MNKLIISISLMLALSPVVNSKDVNLKNYKKKPSFAFGIIGDGPYGESQEPAYDNLIDDVNADRDVRFVIHAGDIKSGGERCDDDLLIRRFEQFQKFKQAFIYTPGDNEWTDCHRSSNGNYLPTERLAFIRQLFFPNPTITTGMRPFSVRTQANFKGREKFVENTIFKKFNVVFSQIHVVGSNNNLNPWNQIDETDSFETPRVDRIEEFNERNEASIDWLHYTFDRAEATQSPGIFITFHANPRFDLISTDRGREGFNEFLDTLLSRTAEYGKPVVIAHGDFHVFLSDKPRLVPWYANQDASGPEDNELVPNLSRLQTFGDSDNHWVKVEVTPKDKDVFRVVPQIVEDNL